MNLIAQQALARALGKALPAPTEKSQQSPTFAQILADQLTPPLPEIVITGPINRVMRDEGKRYALDVVRSAGSSIRNPSAAGRIVDNLTRTAAAQPSSYAAGIKEVIDLLKVTP